MKESNSIIEEIANSSKFNAVYMTTYNFETGFFEKYLIHLFLNNDIRYINLFVDSKQLSIAMEEEIPLHFGKKYYVSPVDIAGSFHPKMILMVGEHKAKLIISSANIKLSGYMANSEIFQSFYCDEKQTEYTGLIYEAAEMFKRLFDETPVPDETTLKILEKFLVENPREYSESHLIHNLDRSFITQLSELIKEEVKQIKVAVPFYDETLMALRLLRDSFHCDDIQLFIQNETSTFPIEFNNTYGIVPETKIYPFDSVTVNGKSKKNFYHGKVYEFYTDEKVYVLYGSANCSSAALMKTVKENGNIECDVLEVRDESDPSVFNCFEKYTDSKLVNGVFETETMTKNPYRFLYSYVEKDLIHLFIRREKSHSSLTFELDNIKLDYKVNGNEIALDVPVILVDDQTPVFDITVKFDNETMPLRCWYINQFKLESFRKNIISYNFNKEVDEQSDQFSEYFNAVIDALFNEEWEEYAEEMRTAASAKFALAAESSDPDDDPEAVEDETDLILDRDISDRYVQKNTLFVAAYDATKKYASKYYGLLAKNDHKEEINATMTLRVSTSQSVTGTRTATSADRQLSRFIRRHVKKHFLFTDTSMLGYDYYVHLCGVILYVIHNMKYKRKIVDFMKDEEALRIKCTFAQVLLDKYSSEQTEQDQILLIRLVLSAIIELGTYHDSEKDALAKKMLIKLNSIIYIRESIRDYIQSLDLSNFVDPDVPFNPEKYVVNLFGYKTLSELKSYFGTLYHKKCIFQFDHKKLLININAKAPEALADNIISEVLKYLNEYNKEIKEVRFYFVVENGADVVYLIKFAGTHINSVKKQFLRPTGVQEFKCRKTDKNWKPVYFDK